MILSRSCQTELTRQMQSFRCCKTIDRDKQTRPRLVVTRMLATRVLRAEVIGRTLTSQPLQDGWLLCAAKDATIRALPSRVKFAP